MLRTTLRCLRSRPRNALHALEPHAFRAASRLGRRQTIRAYSGMSGGRKTAPPGGILLVMAFLVALELRDNFSSRTSPKRLMNESLEIVKTNDEVHRHLGSKLVARGDRVLESTSTKVEQMELVDADGWSCVRIRYNLFGPRGYASVFAEAAKNSKEGEFNFIYVQFNDTHEVVTVIAPEGRGASWDPSMLLGTGAAKEPAPRTRNSRRQFKPQP